MSTFRSGLLSTIDFEAEKVDEVKIVVPLKERQSFSKSMVNPRKVFCNVYRWQFNLTAWKNKCDDAWYEVKMLNVKKAVGFTMDNVPFGKGQERRVYLLKEMDTNGEAIGKMLVAKERILAKAEEFSKAFNKTIYKTPLLKPINQYDAIPPKIVFVNSSVYKCINNNSERAGIPLENYLEGKFTKYNSNNGYVNKKVESTLGIIELKGGKMLRVDFLQAFSHWSYVQSEQKLLLCDLQGVLNQEGKHSNFCLTDAAICSMKSYIYSKRKELRSYGGTDTGIKGVRCFFKSHKCNLVCKCLGLP